jgi:prevent-host-death family protein
MTMVPLMKIMPAGEFKTNCLSVMDEVKAKRETVVITKHGELIAKLVPVSTDKDEIFGFFSGRGFIGGDVILPALSPEEWGNLPPALARTSA